MAEASLLPQTSPTITWGVHLPGRSKATGQAQAVRESGKCCLRLSCLLHAFSQCFPDLSRQIWLRPENKRFKDFPGDAKTPSKAPTLRTMDSDTLSWLVAIPVSTFLCSLHCLWVPTTFLLLKEKATCFSAQLWILLLLYQSSLDKIHLFFEVILYIFLSCFLGLPQG
jgi:hypothetical protein